MLSAGAAPYHCPSTNAWRQVVASSATVCRWRLWVSIHGLAQAVKNSRTFRRYESERGVVVNLGLAGQPELWVCCYHGGFIGRRRREREIDDDGIIIMELLVVIIG